MKSPQRFDTLAAIRALCPLARIQPLIDGQLIYFCGVAVWSRLGKWFSEFDRTGENDLLNACTVVEQRGLHRGRALV